MPEIVAGAPLNGSERARRLNLLLDTVPRDGVRATYAVVQAFLAERGVRLSQSRWTYLLAGTGFERVHNEQELMGALAAFFDIDPAYLLDADGPVPSAIERQLGLLQQVRLREVRLFAARKLGGVSPDALEQITQILRDAEATGDSESPDS